MKKILTLLMLFISVGFYSQESQVFYLLSKGGISLHPKTEDWQLLPIYEDDIKVNNIATLEENTLTLNKSGWYAISGFVNVNPGGAPVLKSDFINMRLYLIYSTDKFQTMHIISSQSQTYRFGNLTVCDQLQLPEQWVFLPKDAQIRWYIQREPHSTLTLYPQNSFEHIDPPTGMQHSMALRIVYIK